ncbi:MAG: hypothetical protein WC389_11830 [Lutibacter sp.]|jgi:hypothetical protein
MNNQVTTMERPVATALQTICTKDGMPVILGKVLTPLAPQLGNLTVIHPTTNDPVLVSDKLGTIAVWFTF